MTVRLWAVASGTQFRKIPVPIEWVYTLTFTPDSQTIAIAGGDNGTQCSLPAFMRDAGIVHVA
jgi:WD40 repeat protein